MRILLVEDDTSAAQVLQRVLTDECYAVDVAGDGHIGWQYVSASHYDLVILDIVLPKLDGLAFCRRLREEGHSMPVLLITALDSSTKKIAGLDAGADDYITKPFELEEFVARVRALLRRARTSILLTLEWRGLRLEINSREVTYCGKSLNLTPKEFALLELFLRNPSQVFSRRAILDSLWSLSDAPGEETVTSHMKGLRRKLSKGGAPADFIDTVYGVGYRLKPTLTSIDAESPPLPLSADDMDRHRKIKTKAALATLWNSVKRHQLARLDQLKQTLAHLRAGQLTEDMRSAGYRAAHGLTGILGIFGLTEGSQTARKIQTLLSDPLLAGSNYAQLADQLATLTESLDHTLSQSTQLSETLLAVPHTPLLVIVDPQLGLMSELARRLQKKGLTVKKISNPTGLQTLLQALNQTGDSQSSDRTQNQHTTSQGAVPEVVLLDAALPTLLPSQVADLAGLLHQVPSLMAVICSADGSLPSRVTALQLGNYPFLHNPDIGEIVNGIVQLRQSPQTPALKILVVDDDPEILAVLRTRLEPQGFQIATLNQPVAFWQTLQTVAPDLILLDISMPDFSGIELCKAVRQAPSWSHVPIVFFTSDADAQMQKRAFRAGADDLVEKSLPSSELLSHLYKQMKRSHLQQAIAAITHGTLSPSP